MVWWVVALRRRQRKMTSVTVMRKNTLKIPHWFLHFITESESSTLPWTCILKWNSHTEIDTHRHRVPHHVTGRTRPLRPHEILVVFWKLGFVKPQWSWKPVSCTWPASMKAERVVLISFVFSHTLKLSLCYIWLLLDQGLLQNDNRPTLFALQAAKLHESIQDTKKYIYMSYYTASTLKRKHPRIM